MDEEIIELGLIKDYLKDVDGNKTYKTHILVKDGENYRGGGYTGTYKAKNLLKYYPNSKIEKVSYIKDFGDDDYGRPIYSVITFYNIYVDVDHTKEIEEIEENEIAKENNRTVSY